MSRTICNIRAVLLGVALGLPALAQSEPAIGAPSASINASPAFADPDIPRLTMDNVTRYFQAVSNMIVAAKDLPGIGAALSIDASESDEQNAARVAAMPAAADALRRAGLTPIQYVKLAGTLLGAMFGGETSGAMPAGVEGDNIRFVKQHRAEIDAMQKKAFALAPKS